MESGLNTDLEISDIGFQCLCKYIFNVWNKCRDQIYSKYLVATLNVHVSSKQCFCQSATQIKISSKHVLYHTLAFVEFYLQGSKGTDGSDIFP